MVRRIIQPKTKCCSLSAYIPYNRDGNSERSGELFSYGQKVKEYGKSLRHISAESIKMRQIIHE